MFAKAKHQGLENLVSPGAPLAFLKQVCLDSKQFQLVHEFPPPAGGRGLESKVFSDSVAKKKHIFSHALVTKSGSTF
jgi:hypothetical protein